MSDIRSRRRSRRQEEEQEEMDADIPVDILENLRDRTIKGHVNDEAVGKEIERR